MMFATLLALGALTLEQKEKLNDPSRWQSVHDRFTFWKSVHGRDFSETEHARRLELFSRAAKHVDMRNSQFKAGEITWKSGLNRFAADSPKERAHRNGYKKGTPKRAAPVLSRKAAPPSPPAKVDWTEGCQWERKQSFGAHKANGVCAVTPVKDQGQCGSCWIFSTTGAIEGAAAIQAAVNNTNPPKEFSESEILDCSYNATNPDLGGCDGGDMKAAYDWVVGNNGLNTEHNYPYSAFLDRCDWQQKRVSVVKITGFTSVAMKGPAMIAALAQQPVSIAIDASSDDFQYYESGVFFGECGDRPQDLDHGVLATGYEFATRKGKVDNTTGVIHVKNSWGDWGDGGYITFRYDSDDDAGSCGMNIEATIANGATLPPVPPPPPPPPHCGGQFYCDYGTSCCVDHKGIFKQDVYTCCKSMETCLFRNTTRGSKPSCTASFKL
jgi:hypothetical protein